MSTVYTADYLLENDAALKGMSRATESLATEESILKFKASAEAKGSIVKIVENKEEALQAVIEALPEGETISSTGSITLQEIGFTEYAKKNPDRWNNIKAKLLATPSEELSRQHANVNYLVTTPIAVTEDGFFTTGDASNTRVGPTLGAQKLVVVVGAQKLVKDLKAARERLDNFVIPVEGAHMRAVYGLPGTQLNFYAEVGTNPFGAPGRITYVFVKEWLGY